MNVRVLTIFFLIGISAMIPQALASAERPDAYLEWLEESYPSSGTGVVRVVDHFMNQNPEEFENLTVYVYTEATEESGGITVTVTETNYDTGIFEGTIFFSETHESGGHRLHVADGDVIGAEYTYSTVPGSDKPEDMIGVGQEIIIKNSPDVKRYVTLKQQLTDHIPLEKIQCPNSLHVLTERTNGNLACVYLSTAEKLVWKLVNQDVTSKQLKPYDYEDVCGFPVTDKMRLDVIYEESTRFTNDGLSYLKVRGGVFTHIELVQHSEYDYPSLDYWFTLKNGKQVYFRIGACNIDTPNVTLGEPSLEYLKIKPETGESDFKQISVPGFPLVDTVTMQPVLDVENCQRTAQYYSTLQSDTMFTRENVTFDPIWKKQVFPLMDYCTDVGNYEMNILDGKINWNFSVK